MGYYDYDEDRSMFADPGGRSALRASSRRNPRNLPSDVTSRTGRRQLTGGEVTAATVR
jgi:hypothetical protein